MGIRVGTDSEFEGMDRSQHAESSYAMSDIASGIGSLAHEQHVSQVGSH
jgi:hypothetical protein